MKLRSRVCVRVRVLNTGVKGLEPQGTTKRSSGPLSRAEQTRVARGARGAVPGLPRHQVQRQRPPAPSAAGPALLSPLFSFPLSSLLSPLLSSPLLAALGSARWRIRECRNLLPLSDKSSISGEAGGGLRALRLLERHTPGAEAPVSGPGSSQPLPTSGESPPGAGSSARPRGGGAPPLAAFPGIATPL